MKKGIHGAIIVAAAAIVYAAPLYAIHISSGPLAAYGIDSYEVTCYAARATSGSDCPSHTGFAACYDALDADIGCGGIGVTSDLKSSSFVISAALAVIVGGCGLGLIAHLINFTSIAIFFRFVGAIGGAIVLINVAKITDKVRHGEADGSQQTVTIGPAVVAAMAAPMVALITDAYH